MRVKWMVGPVVAVIALVGALNSKILANLGEESDLKDLTGLQAGGYHDPSTSTEDGALDILVASNAPCNPKVTVCED